MILNDDTCLRHRWIMLDLHWLGDSKAPLWGGQLVGGFPRRACSHPQRRLSHPGPAAPRNTWEMRGKRMGNASNRNLMQPLSANQDSSNQVISWWNMMKCSKMQRWSRSTWRINIYDGCCMLSLHRAGNKKYKSWLRLRKKYPSINQF